MTDRLLTPDRSIVSMDEARAERERAEADRKRPPGSKMKDLVSREEMMMAVGKASIALGQKMYDQVSGEIAENFEDQEARLMQMIRNEAAAIRRDLASRTLVGRLRRLVRWARGEREPSGLARVLMDEQARVAASPPPEPADPKDALRAELRKRIMEVADGGDVTVPEGLTTEDALEVAREFDGEVRQAMTDAVKLLDRPAAPE